MKKVLLIFCLTLVSLCFLDAQTTPQYKVITIVESIVPGGLGRSRMIENQTEIEVGDYTTERTDGQDSKMGSVKRKDAKVGQFSESKLLNLYTLVGINFQNIASNDALITSKLNELAQEGWELKHVTSGVESDSGETDGKGIFITRMIFIKN